MIWCEFLFSNCGVRLKAETEVLQVQVLFQIVLCAQFGEQQIPYYSLFIWNECTRHVMKMTCFFSLQCSVDFVLFIYFL